MEGRRQVFQLMRFFHQYLPGFEQASLIDTATQVGVRETRRIAGEYVLTEEDAKTGARFPDAIARRFGFLDIGLGSTAAVMMVILASIICVIYIKTLRVRLV